MNTEATITTDNVQDVNDKPMSKKARHSLEMAQKRAERIALGLAPLGRPEGKGNGTPEEIAARKAERDAAKERNAQRVKPLGRPVGVPNRASNEIAAKKMAAAERKARLEAANGGPVGRGRPSFELLVRAGLMQDVTPPADDVDIIEPPLPDAPDQCDEEVIPTRTNDEIAA